MKINSKQTTDYVNSFWDREILPTLQEYVAIPNKSPDYDENWEANGHMDKAVKLVTNWLDTHAIDGWQVSVEKLPKKTPVILVEIPGSIEKTVLMYGHLDKQPEMSGWREPFAPWKPVIQDDKLYGRGGADDGYAIFSSVCALKCLKLQNLSHPRIVILIECSEESGSIDLPPYLDLLENKIGTPDVVVCLDASTGDYERLWMTTSLRGVVNFNLRVDVLNEGIHSGEGSGVVASSFRVLQMLLARIQDLETGTVFPKELNVAIPEKRVEQVQLMTGILGDSIYKKLSYAGNMQPVTHDLKELVLNKTWRPALSYTGIDGVPPCSNSGSVLRPFTSMNLSLRIPPTLPHEQAVEFLTRILTTDVPYNAKVSLRFDGPASGWESPVLSQKLESILDSVSKTYYDRPAGYMGTGGTIPFMAMLGKKFPKTEFVITGVLGPNSNAHGPNEFLHIPYVKKLTACVAEILSEIK